MGIGAWTTHRVRSNVSVCGWAEANVRPPTPCENRQAKRKLAVIFGITICSWPRCVIQADTGCQFLHRGSTFDILRTRWRRWFTRAGSCGPVPVHGLVSQNPEAEQTRRGPASSEHSDDRRATSNDEPLPKRRPRRFFIAFTRARVIYWWE